MNQTFVDKNRKKININEKKWHIVKFIEIYFFKRKKLLYSQKNNLIIVTGSAKQHGLKK